MLTKIKKLLFSQKKNKHNINTAISQKPVIIARSQHNISRNHISKNALKVLYRLKKSGYQAYLVGGGVRDLLLERTPKDFDIVTDALPEDIRKIFRNCRLIGRRFRLAHIYFGSEIIEVSTFRAIHDTKHQNEKGMLLRNNIYGNMEEDVLRRDFTANAIYYNIKDFSLIDYVGGIQDLQKGVLRIIGEPESRYREDPVRMLRAIRFASKLNLKLHKDTIAPISKLSHLIRDISPSRLFDEYMKLFLLNNVENTFSKLIKYGLYEELFPQVKPLLSNDKVLSFIKEALKDTDLRIANKKQVSPVFLLSVFLWHVFLNTSKKMSKKKEPLFKIRQDAMHQVFSIQKKTIMLPKNVLEIIQNVWLLQFRMQKFSERNIIMCYKSPSFRMAYDFLLLRAKVEGDEINRIAEWWRNYVDGK